MMRIASGAYRARLFCVRERLRCNNARNTHSTASHYPKASQPATPGISFDMHLPHLNRCGPMRSIELVSSERGIQDLDPETDPETAPCIQLWSPPRVVSGPITVGWWCCWMVWCGGEGWTPASHPDLFQMSRTTAVSFFERRACPPIGIGDGKGSAPQPHTTHTSPKLSKLRSRICIRLAPRTIATSAQHMKTSSPHKPGHPYRLPSLPFRPHPPKCDHARTYFPHSSTPT